MTTTMTDQVFELDNYRGPLDLLLHLIREQEMEILEVDLSRLCDQYLAALEIMQAVDINVAGEFLVMASTLLLIKSRSILPREEEVDLEEELDPGDELIQQLLEYRKYKTLSLALGRRATDRASRFSRGMHEAPADEADELAEIGLWDLVGSFVRLMEEIGLERDFHTLRSEKPLRAYMRETLDQVVSRERCTLRELVTTAHAPEEVFSVFLALLELIKTQQVLVEQSQSKGEIEISLRADRDTSALAFLYEDETAPRGRAARAGDDEAPAPEGADEGAGHAEPTSAAPEPPESPSEGTPPDRRADGLAGSGADDIVSETPPPPNEPGAGV